MLTAKIQTSKSCLIVRPVLRAFFFEFLSSDSDALHPEGGKVKDDRLHSLIYEDKTVTLESFGSDDTP